MYAMSRLDNIWKSRDVNFKTKLKLYRAFALSVLLYGCESWTLSAETERREQTFEKKCFSRQFRTLYIEHNANECVRQQVDSLAGKEEPLLATVKRPELPLFGHIARHNTIAKNIIQGTLEGKRRRGRQRKN